MSAGGSGDNSCSGGRPCWLQTLRGGGLMSGGAGRAHEGLSNARPPRRRPRAQGNDGRVRVTCKSGGHWPHASDAQEQRWQPLAAGAMAEHCPRGPQSAATGEPRIAGCGRD